MKHWYPVTRNKDHCWNLSWDISIYITSWYFIGEQQVTSLVFSLAL